MNAPLRCLKFNFKRKSVHLSSRKWVRTQVVITFNFLASRHISELTPARRDRCYANPYPFIVARPHAEFRHDSCSFLCFPPHYKESHVDSGFSRNRRSARAQCQDTLGPARPRAGLHDGDIQPAICLDLVHQAARDSVRRAAVAVANHLLLIDCAADFFLAIPGQPGRPLRPQAADFKPRRS
jgi:hypothetical protein